MATWKQRFSEHVDECMTCSGPDDGCEEGQALEELAHNEPDDLLSSRGATLYLDGDLTGDSDRLP